MRLEPQTALLSGRCSFESRQPGPSRWMSQPLSVSEIRFILLLIHASNVCRLERGIFSSRSGGISLVLNAMSNHQIGPFIGLRHIIVSDKKQSQKIQPSIHFWVQAISGAGFVIPN